MTCEKAREALPELLDPRTPAAAQGEARAHLASCPACQRDFAALSRTAEALDAMPTPQPSPRLRRHFYAMLEEEKHSAESVRLAARRVHRTALARWLLSPLAAAALVALGFALGQRTAPRAVPETPAPVDTTRRELTALRDQVAKQNEQIERMTKVFVAQTLMQQQSPANTRLNNVLAKARQETVDDKSLEQLVLALTLDPSVNIRLRALEALYPHSDRQVVRAGVLAALPREHNPLVQLELIDLIATAQDANAAPMLEQISADESAHAAVRDAARLALAQL